MKCKDLKVHSVHVDVAPLADLSGELRVVTVHRDLRVLIEYLSVQQYREGDWEPGLVYSGRYSDWGSLVRALEEYLQKPIGEWRDFSAEPLDVSRLPCADDARSRDFFMAAVHLKRLPLPKGAVFRLTSVYWRQIEQYGDWDEDRAWRDQEASLNEGGPGGPDPE